MIYCLGLASELNDIRQNLDEGYSFVLIEDVGLSHDLGDAELFLIGPSVDNPIKLVQAIVANDPLLSIIIFTATSSYNQIKQSLLFSMAVGKNTSCIAFDASKNYSSVFQNAVLRTQQKRSFSKFNRAAEVKLAQLTSPEVKLDNLGHILEHAPIGAILIDKDFRIVGANKTSRQMFMQLNSTRVPLESIFPINFNEIVKLVKSEAVERSLIIEDVYGNYFDLRSSPIPDQHLENTILLVNDVTERREKNKRIIAILESLPHIAWTADPDGNINYYNAGWYSYTNTEPSEGMGERWASIVHPDDLTLLLSRWKESVTERRSFQHAARLRRSDGEYRWHLSRASPIISKNRNVEMWVGTSTEVHDQVILNEELERKVRERTRLLEETNAELEQFAHISSHDLQEPLRKIQTFAHMVKEDGSGQLNENVRRYVDKIITTSAQMSKLLKDLLNFTKINHQEPESVIDLNEIIHQIREDLELAIQQNAASISSEDLPRVKGRPLQLKQLFYNIINNSIKYRKSDVAPVVLITCKKLEKQEQSPIKGPSKIAYWEITIKDNGIGFDQRYADQIFTVFQRLHTRSAYEGTGIGLAIARKVVANHAGEIFAISSPGNGAEFHIILPALMV